ncbi:MAG: response regulator [Vicinamibacterales bacterium]
MMSPTEKGSPGGLPRIKVLVVDDSVVVRKMVTDVLAADPEIEVVGTAANGRIGLQKITQVNPDIVTLDVEMPEMDGLQALAEIRKTHPRLPIIMFSTLTERGGQATLEALSLGATDYVTKPANVGSVALAQQRIRDELIPKLKVLCRKGSNALRDARAALRVVTATAAAAPLRWLRQRSPVLARRDRVVRSTSSRLACRQAVPMRSPNCCR